MRALLLLLFLKLLNFMYPSLSTKLWRKLSLGGVKLLWGFLIPHITQFPEPCCVVVPLSKKPVKEPLRACVQPSMLIVNWWGWQDERTAEHVVSQAQAVDRPLVIITAAAHILTTQLLTILLLRFLTGLKKVKKISFQENKKEHLFGVLLGFFS